MDEITEMDKMCEMHDMFVQNNLYERINIISYGLNLSFRSPESIGEYSEKNLAPSYFSF